MLWPNLYNWLLILLLCQNLLEAAALIISLQQFQFEFLNLLFAHLMAEIRLRQVNLQLVELEFQIRVLYRKFLLLRPQVGEFLSQPIDLALLASFLAFQSFYFVFQVSQLLGLGVARLLVVPQFLLQVFKVSFELLVHVVGFAEDALQLRFFVSQHLDIVLQRPNLKESQPNVELHIF